MKVKLSHSQMTSLASVLQKTIGDDETPPSDLQLRLIYCMLNLTYKQVQKKLIDRKKKYNLILTEPEALAFWVCFSRISIDDLAFTDITEKIYQNNLLTQLKNCIHKFFTDN